MPAVAQGGDFVRYPDDPKVIFNQDFEVPDGVDPNEAFELWSHTAVDTIKEITYFSKIGTGQVSGTDIYGGSADYQVFMVRKDSIIPLLNGVVTSNNKDDKANAIYANEDYGLIYDGGLDADRNAAFSEFGQNGGKYYFNYTSADATGANTYSSGKVANYRRNLFVRGLNIEDQSSYRLTFYIKATKKAKTAPYFYADIMRGYYNSEKPFSMGLRDDAANYEYNNRFEFEKSDFTGDWEKVTYMTYYLNDSIASGFVYRNGYYWDSEWRWRPTDDELAAAGKTLKAGDSLNYINQPDKFFVRLSFSSDSTEFLLDNLSLTKSWIGGVEHHEDMLRVDFGYDTNLKELAKNAESETGIAAVELGGEYFKVWGFRNGTPILVDINSAEYHDDGYMYMWTKPAIVGGKTIKSLFSVYDSVLVSFTNPDDPALRLNYNGKLFPMALDTAWIKAGKKVHDFNNERSTPNPNIGRGVYSIKNLPPKFISSPYENGSFGLKSINSITINYTRKLEFDDKGEMSDLGWLRVTKAGVKEVWTISESTDSTTTYVRSSSDIAKGDLSGDYTFEFVNIKGEGTDYAKNAVISLGFGGFELNPDLEAVYQSNFKENSTETQSVPEGIAIWNGKDAYTEGTGKNVGTKSRLFWTNPTSGFDAGMYISGRAEGTDDGHMACGLKQDINLNAGTTYSLSFSAAHWESAKTVKILIYPYTSDIKSVKDENKTLIGTFAPTVRSLYTDIQVYSAPYGNWPSGVESFSFNFTVPEDGTYVLEWVTPKNGTDGILMSDIEIQELGSLSFPYVSKLNKTVFAALEKLEWINDNEDPVDMYHGDQYNALDSIADYYSYDNWQDTTPSAYLAAAAIVQAEIGKMQLRIDTVDLFYATESKVYDKLAEFEDDDKVDYQDLAAYITLSKHIEANEDWDCSEKTTAELTAEINSYEDEIKVLDARMDLIGKIDAKLAQIKDSIDNSVFKYFDEFTTMQGVYETVNDLMNKITDSDDALTAYYNQLSESYNNFIFKPQYLEAQTRQIKELYQFAASMGSDFGGNKDEIKAKVDALQVNDPALENMLREYAILQVYKALEAKSDTIDEGLDVSVLIPNYFMATKAQAGVDMRLKSSNGKWAVKSSPNTTVLPNWTITFGGSSGTTYPGREAMDWEKDGHEFVAGFHFEPNTTGSVGTSVAGLPAGYYTASFDMIQNNLSNSQFDFVTDSAKVTLKGSSYKSASQKVVSTHDLRVPATGELQLTYSITSASTSGHVDVAGVGLILTAEDPTVVYKKLREDQETKINTIVTFADAPQAEEVGVQYINLSGIQVSAPKQGEIIIKRSILSNGQTEAQIELIK